jgi:hypothetical protein
MRNDDDVDFELDDALLRNDDDVDFELDDALREQINSLLAQDCDCPRCRCTRLLLEFSEEKLGYDEVMSSIFQMFALAMVSAPSINLVRLCTQRAVVNMIDVARLEEEHRRGPDKLTDVVH